MKYEEIIKERLDDLSNEESRLFEELATINSKDEKDLSEAELKRKGEIEQRLKEIEQETKKLEEDSKSEETSVNTKTKELSTKQKVFMSVAIIGLSGLLGCSFGNAIKNKNNGKVGQTDTKSITAVATKEVVPTSALKEIVINTPEPTATIMPMTKVEATATPEPTKEPLSAVDRIYEEDIKPMLEDLDDEIFASSFTKEDIEDMIRIFNGEVPVYKEYDENTVGEAIIRLTNIFANRTNRSNHNKLYPVHYSYLVEDDKVLASYAESYDEIYNKIALYRAENNADGFVEMVGVLGSKLYNEWFLHGMFGGFDPYSFDTEKQYFALNTAVNRFPNYVTEYMISNDLTICIPACYDVNGEEYKLVEVRDIFEAICNGTSNNKAISVMRGNEVVDLFGETYASLQETLNRKANNNVKVLK